MKKSDHDLPDVAASLEMLAKIVSEFCGTMTSTVVPKPVAGSELRPDGSRFPYVVHVDDLWNWPDPDRGYVHGGFESATDAVAACRYIVDAFVVRTWQPGMSVEKTVEFFRREGFDPRIVSLSGAVPFDPRSRVEGRARALIAGHEAEWVGSIASRTGSRHEPVRRR